MQWHEFIFSEQRKHKLLRHLVFWVSWWLYFLLCYILFQQQIPGLKIRPYYLNPGDHLPLKTFLLILLYAAVCYPFIYILLPKVIKGSWLKATADFILLCILLFVAADFLFWEIFLFIDSFLGTTHPSMPVTRYWPAFNFGLMNFAKVATTAAIIKYVKYWWLKNKESQQLEKEKINADLLLLKGQVHPDFLLKTLNNIYTHAMASSPLTSGMVMKLSDLLSYMLYECDQALVPLDKEIAMMKEYMQLEKIRHHDDPEIEVSVKGDLDGQMIAPFLLLPFIENSFSHCGQMTDQFWINLDISVDGTYFTMKLTNGISDKVDNQLMSTNRLTNVHKRLTILYPGNHELKMTSEQEMNIVLLNVQLDNSTTVNNKNKNPATTSNKEDMITFFKYATD